MNSLLLFLIVFSLLALRQNMVLILLFSAAYVQVVYGDGTVLYVVEDFWTAMDNHALLAIPMYLIVGNLIARGTIAGHLVEVFRSATDWMPGGLGVATILACAFFSALSGIFSRDTDCDWVGYVPGPQRCGIQQPICDRIGDVRWHSWHIDTAVDPPHRLWTGDRY